MQQLQAQLRREYGQPQYIRVVCPSCHGSRFIGEFICGECTGDGSVIEFVEVRSSRKLLLACALLLVAVAIGLTMVLNP